MLCSTVNEYTQEIKRKNPPNKKQMSFQISEEMYEKIREASFKERSNYAQLTRYAIYRFLNENGYACDVD